METLNTEEQAQFKEMQTQEAADKEAIEIEKQEPVAATNEAPKEAEKDKTVPLSALQEERERRKASDERVRQSELNQVRLDERLKAINERLAPAPQPKEAPNPDVDALGSLKATAEKVQELQRFQEQQLAQAQQQQALQMLVSQASAKEADFIRENPDYLEAGNFLRQNRYNELLAMRQDPYTAQQIINQEALQIAANALQQGQNPAEMIYSIAKQRGYAKQEKQTDTDKLARIAEGQKANTSLGSVNSTPGKPSLDGKALLSMNDEDFSKWLDKLPSKERSKFLGA